MDKGKSKADGTQGKETRAKSKGHPDKTMNLRGENAPQASSHDEREMPGQLSTFQDSSARREGRSFLGSDMLENPFFKDPFFTRPFGEPFKSSGLIGANGILNHEIFDMGRWRENLLDQFQFNNPPSIFQDGNRRNAPIEGGGGRRNVQIEELPKHHDNVGGRARSSNQEPIIEHPDDDDQKGSSHHRSPHSNSLRRGRPLQPSNNQSNSYSFYSSSVMCGGSNGPYYASQTTRRQGPNGVIEEEHQEKDGNSGRASHRVSHGLGEKGHSLVRERKEDGQEEKFETLHNLGEEEVPQFESDWERVAEKDLPKWPNSSSPHLGLNSRSRSRPALPPGENSRSNQYNKV